MEETLEAFSSSLEALPLVCLERVLTASRNLRSREACRWFRQAFGALHCGLRPARLPSALQLQQALLSSPSIHTLDLAHSNARVTNDTLQTIASVCTRLRTLNLEGCMRITDAGLSLLAPLASTLQTLRLDSCSNLGPTTAETLAPLTRLRALTLPHISTVWKAQQSAHLARLTSLTRLDILEQHMLTTSSALGSGDEDTDGDDEDQADLDLGFGDRMMADLTTMVNLAHLHLERASGVDDFLPLAALTALTHLSLGHAWFTDADMAAIASLPALAHLLLPSCRGGAPAETFPTPMPLLTDFHYCDPAPTHLHVIQHAPNLTALTYADPSHTLHNHMYFFGLAQIPRLVTLTLPGTTLDDHGMGRLAAALPLLQRLAVNDVRLSPAAWASLPASLSRLRELRTFRGTGNPPVPVAHLDLLLSMPFLTRLTLRHCKLRLPPGPAAHPPQSPLRHLSLTECTAAAAGLFDGLFAGLFAGLFDGLARRLPRVEMLVVQDMQRLPAAELRQLPRMTTLQRLELRRNSAAVDGGVVVAAAALPLLRAVSIEGAKLVTAADLRRLPPLLPDGFQELELSDCGVGEEHAAWAEFAAACPDVWLWG